MSPTDDKDSSGLPTPIYRIGDADLDVSLRQVRKGGKVTPLQPKVFELLVYLIEHSDRVVSKDELQRSLWRDTIVTDSSLSRVVMKARRAIDDVDQSKLVTVHGVGFRLAALAEFEAPAEPETNVPPIATRRFPVLAGVIGAVLGIGAIVAYIYINEREADSVQSRIDEIHRLAEDRRYLAAYDVAVTLRDKGVVDLPLGEIWPQLADRVTVTTTPAGADVYARAIESGEGAEQASTRIGRTPIENIEMGRASWFVTIEKNGFASVERIVSSEYGRATVNADAAVQLHVDLVPVDELPEDMVHVPASEYQLKTPDLPTGISEWVDEYFIDRYEVSNSDYLRFVEMGGYRQSTFWPDPLIDQEGSELAFLDLVARLTDRTGLKAPRHWSERVPPLGEENWPVTGITWFEASAYCRFSGKTLPDVFQWEKAARDGIGTNSEGSVMPWGYVYPGEPVANRANYRALSPVDVDRYPGGISPYGAYSMAGNVKEWTASPVNVGKIVTGGSFRDPRYVFAEYGEFHPLTSLPTLGFRCARYRDPDRASAAETGATAIPLAIRTPVYTPVDEAEFERILAHYRYDRIPENGSVVDSMATPDWVREEILFEGPDPSLPVTAYLWLPKAAAPPYQTIAYVPGVESFFEIPIYESVERYLGANIRSGRAVFAVVMRGMVGREHESGHQWPEPDSVQFLEDMIEHATELRLGVDYLESRDDIDMQRLGYTGLSWGAGSRLGFSAIEQRVKAIVFIGGGIDDTVQPTLPEANNVNFAPYIKVPKLLLNGRHDEEHPWFTRALPLWELLSEPKELKLFDGVGHIPPTELRTPAINAFFDKYFGPVTPR